MNVKLRYLVKMLVLSLLSHVAMASETLVGYVKTVEGDATVLMAGKSIKAQPGTPVNAANILKTGKRASMGVTLKDNTLLSIGPDTELVVDEFLYAPAQGDLKLGASLRKGSLNYVSGMIARLKPEAISIQTPTGNIGVRGTHFVATVEEE